MKQYFLNFALWLDLTGNTLSGGNPRETISRRTARARLAGQEWAAVACAILTWIGRVFFGAKQDHCTWSLSGGDSTGAEIWAWCPGSGEDADGLPLIDWPRPRNQNRRAT